MTMDGKNVVWGNSIQEVLQQCPHIFNNPTLQDFDKEELVKSVTFIEGDIYQNKELLDKDP
jgi:hypothetical protein